MRIRSPSSRAGLQLRFSIFDVVLASVSPILALYVRAAYILQLDQLNLTIGYCLVSLACSLIAFAAFGINGGIPRYYSVHDLLNIGKAVAIAELLTCIALFTFTRLEGIPRSTPAVHALILGAGLIVSRASWHLADKRRSAADRPQSPTDGHVILIGLTDLSVLYMKFLEAAGDGGQRVIALLDDDPRWLGRTVDGVRVLGGSSELEPLIDEFAVHGIRTDRIVVGGRAEILPEEARRAVLRVCEHRSLECVFVPQLFGLDPATPAVAPATTLVARAPPATIGFSSSRYLRAKRLLDFALALGLLIGLLPLWALICVLAFLNVGSPILFWQQRIGLNGRDFLLYKIRTLKSSVDWNRRATVEQPLSWIGRMLRQTRLDEFPQLLNVLVGDMSLIGPRPLLPRDQPANPSLRLMIRPGITGWAQVHGGIFLSAEEKEELDASYLRHASLWLDLRIVAMTLRTLFRGDRRSDKLLARARRLGTGTTDAARRSETPGLAPAASGASRAEGEAPLTLPS
jgi:lipopolysaccharide/colanic/teichoic acid biosynthesis glycosyltransferase